MTTAVLNEKRYALSFVCLMVACFWAGLMLFSVKVIAGSHTNVPYPPTATVSAPAN